MIKFRAPVSLLNLFDNSWIMSRMSMRLRLPKTNLQKSKVNFVFSGSLMWNNLIYRLLETCPPGPTGLIVPGSIPCSDMNTPISFVKNKLKSILLNTQEVDTLGYFDKNRSIEWNRENFYVFR